MKTPDIIFYYHTIKELPFNEDEDYGIKNAMVTETCYCFNFKEDISYLNGRSKKMYIKYVAVCIEYRKVVYFGIARCSHNDNYNVDKGRSIARTRAFDLICFDHAYKEGRKKNPRKYIRIQNEDQQIVIPNFMGLKAISRSVHNKIGSFVNIHVMPHN